MRGTKYGCNFQGDKESKFFPKLTGQASYNTRVDKTYENTRFRYLPKEAD
jgi:hypothetical protein